MGGEIATETSHVFRDSDAARYCQALILLPTKGKFSSRKRGGKEDFAVVGEHVDTRQERLDVAIEGSMASFLIPALPRILFCLEAVLP